MSVIYKCDHCGCVLDAREKRSVTISNKNYELCAKHKEEFEKVVKDFFNVQVTIMDPAIPPLSEKIKKYD